jgi:uncharacterized protein YkwD
MKRIVVSLALFVSGFVVMAQPAQLEPRIHPDSFNLNQDSMRIYMLQLVNDFRVKYHKGTLQYDSSLNVGAMNHAIYMSSYSCDDEEWGHYQHDSTNKYFTGYSPSDRCQMPAGENAAADVWFIGMTMKQISKSVFDTWVRSKYHRQNMLDRRYELFGYALVLRKKMSETTISLQDFTMFGGYEVYAVQTFY